jgi:hypothetical protein
MKKLWERSSRSCDSSQLTPPFRQALDRALQQLEEPLNEISCIETRATQLRSGLLIGKKKTVTTALILTPRWLFQVIDEGDKGDPFVLIFYLDKMEISANTMQLAARLNMEDFGVDVIATIRGQLKRSSTFLGFEDNAQSAQFIQTLKDTIKKANQP